ncbi:MAG: methylase [Bacteroidales bacterium]|nr:methylase [Bacteroidales bacterium]
MQKSAQSIAAKAFAERWAGKGYEKGESQPFWMELIQTVLGVERPYDIISFENQVKLSTTSFIDAYIEPTHTLIEQKSIDKDLRKAIPQSDGTLLTPFQQAKRYAAELPYSKRPRWMVICNFKEFHVYDMENPQGEPEVILLENLETEYYRLQFLVEQGNEHLKKEMEVSLQAGEIIGQIYDEFLKQYINPDDPHTLKSLNVLCVRLVFCLYAEDAGLFGEKRCMFHDYLSQFKPGEGDMRDGLIKLFETLNTPVDQRSPYLKPSLKAFPYCNGGLFSDRDIEIPFFNETLANLILKHASDDFDWSQISPTIFGAVFESTLNPETRRSGGMHYTSIENIHKVIDPLFFDELKAELTEIKDEPIEKKRIQKAREYQDKLASLKFLDPACGSGNFLTETYLSLRRLENEAMFVIGDIFNPIKVDIHQFYGIEINDFAVATATTALWIAEAQMMAETERLMHVNLDFLPLKSYHNIIEGNALRMDWNHLPFKEETTTIIAEKTHLSPIREEDNLLQEPVIKYGEINLYTKEIDFAPRTTVEKSIDFDYIIGNPPFVGYSMQSKEQKDDILAIYTDTNGKPYPTAGKIDYVSGWFWKAAEYMSEAATPVRTALVSTNSITQGEQVAGVWKPLFERFGVQIDFAWRTFRWDSESSLKAHVHCVIIGFSCVPSEHKRIFTGKVQTAVSKINPYLIDAENVFVESRNKPLCDVPKMVYGNKPTDGGFLFLDDKTRKDIVSNDPRVEKFIRKIYGSEEYINNKERYCLWLVGASPADIRSISFIMNRINLVREFRLSSPKEATRKSAEWSNLFQEVRQPDSDYIIVPRVSSENRRYIPIGFVSPDIIASDSAQMIPDATLYHFGILTSNVHNAWMRVVCGRLKSDYRYSKDIVYNNFPWPTPTEAQKVKIKQTAQAILDARAKYPDCSLADLYDELTMPVELRKAHQENDKAVMESYGFNWRTMTESDCVAELFKMYQKLTRR